MFLKGWHKVSVWTWLGRNIQVTSTLCSSTFCITDQSKDKEDHLESFCKHTDTYNVFFLVVFLLIMQLQDDSPSFTARRETVFIVNWKWYPFFFLFFLLKRAWESKSGINKANTFWSNQLWKYWKYFLNWNWFHFTTLTHTNTVPQASIKSHLFIPLHWLHTHKFNCPSDPLLAERNHFIKKKKKKKKKAVIYQMGYFLDTGPSYPVAYV